MYREFIGIAFPMLVGFYALIKCEKNEHGKAIFYVLYAIFLRMF